MNIIIWAWAGWFLLLIAIDFYVPYRLLQDVPGISGSFLFWTIWILVAIASMFVMFLRWRDDDHET